MVAEVFNLENEQYRVDKLGNTLGVIIIRDNPSLKEAMQVILRRIHLENLLLYSSFLLDDDYLNTPLIKTNGKYYNHLTGKYTLKNRQDSLISMVIKRGADNDQPKAKNFSLVVITRGEVKLKPLRKINGPKPKIKNLSFEDFEANLLRKECR